MIDRIKRLGARIASLMTINRPRSTAWHQRDWINRAVAGIEDALIATDQAGRVMFLNGVAESLTGWPLDRAYGRRLDEVAPLVDESSGERKEIQMPGSGPGGATEWLDRTHVIAKDGRPIPVEYRVAPILGRGGRNVGIVVLFRDLSGRRRVQEAMAQMAAIVETSDDAIIGVTMDGSVMTWNGGAERLYGYSAEEIIGRPYSGLFPSDRSDELGEIREAIRRGKVMRHQDTARLRRDGSKAEISVSISPITGQEGAIVGFSSIGRDIAERKRAQEELRRTELLRGLAEAQEGERRRIAHDLHDQMEQHLAALKFGLEGMMADSPDRDRLRRLLELVSQVGRDVRRIALELRPATLDDLGLHAALTNYVAEWAERSGIEVDFHDTGLEGVRLPTRVETALYRVVQEALTNVFKHAEAGRVSVILERRDDKLHAIIEDNGRGFDYDEREARPASERRLGLLGMRERIKAIGGDLLVETAPGEGTSLFIRVPLGDGEERQ